MEDLLSILSPFFLRISVFPSLFSSTTPSFCLPDCFAYAPKCKRYRSRKGSTTRQGREDGDMLQVSDDNDQI